MATFSVGNTLHHDHEIAHTIRPYAFRKVGQHANMLGVRWRFLHDNSTLTFNKMKASKRASARGRRRLSEKQLRHDAYGPTSPEFTSEHNQPPYDQSPNLPSLSTAPNQPSILHLLQQDPDNIDPETTQKLLEHLQLALPAENASFPENESKDEGGGYSQRRKSMRQQLKEMQKQQLADAEAEDLEVPVVTENKSRRVSFGDDLGNSDDSDQGESVDKNRSPSPVIIWRPTARVKVARDIPAELQSIFLGQKPDRPERSSNADQYDHLSTIGALVATAPIQPYSARTHNHGRRHHRPLPPPPESSFTFRPRNTKKAPKYGAWYMPTKRWQVQGNEDNLDSDPSRLAASYLDPGVARPDNAKNQALVTKAQELKHQIPGLYISKAYKSFIKDRAKKLSSAGNTRLPHYLQRVKDDNEMGANPGALPVDTVCPNSLYL